MATIDDLIAAADSPGPDAREAVSVLAVMGEKALPAIAAAIRGSSRVVAGNLGYAVSQMRDPAIVPELVQLLGDPKMGLAYVAFRAFGRQDAARAAEPLITFMRDREQGEARRSLAADGLGDLHAEAATPVLVEVLDEALAEEQVELALSCVRALAKLGSHGRADVAVDVLEKSKDASHRSLAAEVLQYAVCPRMAGALAAGLRDKVAEVRLKVCDALFYLGNRAALDALCTAVGSKPPNIAGQVVTRIDEITGAEFDETTSKKTVAAWWEEEKQNYEPRVCYRAGQPIQLQTVADQLGEPNAFRRVIEELQVITGQDFGYVRGVPSTFQVLSSDEISDRARAWIARNGKRFRPGALYKWGFERPAPG
jgi:hypothetical protein